MRHIPVKNLIKVQQNEEGLLVVFVVSFSVRRCFWLTAGNYGTVTWRGSLGCVHLPISLPGCSCPAPLRRSWCLYCMFSHVFDQDLLAGRQRTVNTDQQHVLPWKQTNTCETTNGTTQLCLYKMEYRQYCHDRELWSYIMYIILK